MTSMTSKETTTVCLVATPRVALLGEASADAEARHRGREANLSH